MKIDVILQLLALYGPTILPLIQRILQLRDDGKTEVTADDIAELIAFGQKTSEDYLRAQGITIVDGKVIPLPPKTD